VKWLLIFLLITLPSSMANAQTDTAKVAKLMEVMGLLEMWQEQIEAGKTHNAQIGEKAMEQIMSQLNPSLEYKARFSAAFNTYLKKLEAPWSAQEIVNVWANYYGPHFTDDELDRLIAFYTSDLGRKDIAATKRAMTQFTEHFQKASQPIFDKATKEYIDNLKIVARECNCQKKSNKQIERTPDGATH